nr:hypothetical protein [Lujinxingiaceae bacterium]
QYLDLTPPRGSISAGSAVATKGDSSAQVALSLNGVSAQPGAEVDYQVRVRSGAHSQLSAVTRGRRAIGALSYQWERSSGTTNTNFSPLASATTALFNDATAPSNGDRRYYRNRISAANTDTVTSQSDYGFRTSGCAVNTSFFGEIGGIATTGAITQNANIAAVRNAILRANELEPPAQQISPAIQITNAIVIATSFRTNLQFWIQDSNSAIQLYLTQPLAIGIDIAVGQRVSFVATHSTVYSGQPQISSVSNFQVNSYDNPVPYIERTGQDITMNAHYYRNVRVSGQLGQTATACGGSSFCYDLTHGPASAPKTVVFRSASTSLTPGACVTFLGPVVAFPGPLDYLSAEPIPQLDTILYEWHVADLP